MELGELENLAEKQTDPHMRRVLLRAASAYRKPRDPHRVRACEECSGPPDAPMLRDEVWRSIRGEDHLLFCTACVERRLGRHIDLGDLLDCLANRFLFTFIERTKA